MGELSTLSLANGASSLLSAPVPAAVLGLALGVVMLHVTRMAARFMTPEDPAIGMARVLVVNSLVMIAAVASLAAFFFFARDGLTYFGIALVAGFLAAASVELFRFGGLATGAGRRR